MTTEAETQPTTPQPATDDDSPHASLRSTSFLGLLFTQLLTATNDNAFRWLVIGVGKDYVARPDQGRILMLGTACFVLPYLVLAAPAGYFADRYSKRQVIVACKIAEIAIMLLGVTAIVWGSLTMLFFVVALMGAQSALFSPSKMGCIPEILPARKISAANGLFGLMTVSATVLGMVIGSQLSDSTGLRGQENWWISGVTLVGIALVGTFVSLGIEITPIRNPARHFPWNVPTQTIADLKSLIAERALLRVALGIVFFWSIGAMAQMNIDQFAFEAGATREVTKTPLLIALVVGIGAGSILAGIWSRGKVELGILPLGALGVALSSLLLFTVHGEIFNPTVALQLSFGLIAACGLLLTLGISAGLFSVPLESYLQHHSPPKTRGSILAAANFLIFAGILLFSVLFAVLRVPFHEGPPSLPAHLAQPDDPRHVEAISAAVAEFQRQWMDEETEPEINTFLADLAPEARRAALAQLVFEDVRQRAERQLSLPDFDYLDRYPDEAARVREVLLLASKRPLLSARGVFLFCGVLTIPVFLYIVCLLPQASVRFIVWLASSTVYRIRLHDQDKIPTDRGAILAANHISWVDGILLLVSSSRQIRFIVWSGNFQSPVLRWLANLAEAIMISEKPKEAVRALRTAREALKRGELVCIFPEGGISRSGQLQGFKPGILKMLEGTDAVVVPVFLDGMWGSIFSFDRGKFFWKIPRRIPYPVNIHFGEPLSHPKDVHAIRQAVQELGAITVEKRSPYRSPVPKTFIRQCKRRLFARKVADTSGVELTGGQLLMRSLILRRLLRRNTLTNDEQYVGVLLPPAAGSVIVNASLALDRRIACNLNYTVSSDVLNQCIEQAGIRHVLTSHRFMEKMDFQLNAELVFLEDFKPLVTLADKVSSALAAFVSPSSWLDRSLGLQSIHGDDLLTVIFTSGSTGTPKGVMLTHANVASNAEAVDQMVHLTDKDVVIGILPFFHSFGYTIAMWTVLIENIEGVYHFNPLDGKQVGKLCKKYQGSILLATPTFLRNYLRRCDADELASLDVVVAGAEKLPMDLLEAFEKKFGVRPVEGYGTTELSPLVSVNIPPSRSRGNFQVDCREGSVGRPIPGVSAKVTDLDSGEELGTNQDGMLWIRGPNVMKGYLNQPERTAEVLKDGWYMTGDIAHIDDDGFIHITGRESRFSKIGGEMVPHIRIEEEINRILGAEDEMQAMVTALPDEKKGERLIVLHKAMSKSVEEVRQGLLQAGFPNIFVPGPKSFVEVEELPVLGSGKLDLKRLKQLAAERCSET
jgi:acyl-[acyl-carrier-protein]-phospholipid O-acyltransferase / long-chain-fatty-acid--[acyl-carrier-protein] ligase